MPSVGVRALVLERFGNVTEELSFDFRWGFSAATAASEATNWAKSLSTAAAEGSSCFFAPGVFVLDLDRLVDFPNEPVSGTALRRDVEAPSGLAKLSKKPIVLII